LLAAPNLPRNINSNSCFAVSKSSIISTPLPAAKPSAFKTNGGFCFEEI
jgi:hypothetical protein